MTAARSDADTVLLVEDDRALRDLLTEELTDAGWPTRAVASAEEAWSVLEHDAVALVLSDLRLPGASGMALMDWIGALPNPPSFIVVTAFGTIDQAVEAIKNGADDFLTKPIDSEHLLVRLERVLEGRRLRQRIRQLESLVGTETFHGLGGRSQPMRELFDMTARIGAGDGPVLIMGESGTGKELVARAVHAESRRASRPLVAVNCAGVPADLLESEFFGHTRGAFTGAHQARAGLLQEADGGTLFLDEIGEMPASLQAKLLRVLEDGVVRPVGSDRSETVDVRVIAATNRDLMAAIGAGEFREDLYYRLETFQIRVPPLRERGDDVDLLAMRHLKHFASRLDRPVERIGPDALMALRAYEFPGNVRELANIMERAVTFCEGSVITVADLPDHVGARHQRARSLPPEAVPVDELATLAEMETRYLHYVLRRCDGNKRRAADVLGIGRRTLYRRLEPGSEPDGETPP